MGLWRLYSSLDPNINVRGETVLEAPARLIMPHTSSDAWRDKPQLNPFFFYGVFPSTGTLCMLILLCHLN